jgi:ubiquinone/menaquinone biosynthesis C-methylase UbiE
MATSSEQQQKDLIRARFTRTAEVFGDYAVSYRVRFAESLMRLVSAGKGDLVIDLACGPGTLALRFAPQVRRVYGLDLTPAMLSSARNTATKDGIVNLDFTLGDAQNLPFPDRSLDIAVTSYSLHHVPDPERVVSEMARVVKPGGRVGIIDIFASEDPKAAAVSNRIEKTRDPSHTRTLAKSELAQLLSDAGLRVIGSEVEEPPRSFDHWLHVAGWQRGDVAYVETRRLMEDAMRDDATGFHAKFAPLDAKKPGEPHDIQMVNPTFFISAIKP